MARKKRNENCKLADVQQYGSYLEGRAKSFAEAVAGAGEELTPYELDTVLMALESHKDCNSATIWIKGDGAEIDLYCNKCNKVIISKSVTFGDSKVEDEPILEDVKALEEVEVSSELQGAFIISEDEVII